MEKNNKKCPDCGALGIWQYLIKDNIYQCDVCGEAYKHRERTIKDIRLHQNKGSIGSTVQVDYGNGWEKIKIHIEE